MRMGCWCAIAENALAHPMEGRKVTGNSEGVGSCKSQTYILRKV